MTMMSGASLSGASRCSGCRFMLVILAVKV
jgi:hypothetical protein